MRLWKQPASIRINADAFAVEGLDPPREPVALDDIQEVTFFKRDELTTDLICCDIVVCTAQGVETWFLHEELPGWDDLTRLLERLPGFDSQWFRKVAWPAFASNPTSVFKRV
ncbi:MAG: hypothetical protein JNJ63_04720 [Hyphomonadaceae bacterium]|nr:hypothetical protein [Hyphomonadaceae bacterium]